MTRDQTAGSRIAQAEAENEMLRAVIDKAPHSPNCPTLLPPPNDLPAWLCTCWKADYDAAKETPHD